MGKKQYYKIEPNIPVPEIDMTSDKKYYPWDKMGVGDSFLVKGDLRDKHKTVTSAASHRGRKYGEAYVTRYVIGGLRVWRLK
jgi:hypothetical protein